MTGKESLFLESDIFNNVLKIAALFERASGLKQSQAAMAVFVGACNLYKKHLVFKKEGKIFIVRNDLFFLKFDDDRTLQKHRRYLAHGAESEYSFTIINPTRSFRQTLKYIQEETRAESDLEAIFLGTAYLLFFITGSQNGYTRHLSHKDIPSITFPFKEDLFLSKCKQMDHLH